LSLFMPAPPVSEKPKPLTTQQLRFVEEFCVDGKGTEAAKRAGYSAKSARQQASNLLADERIQAAKEQRLRALSLSAGQTIRLISEIAETRLNQFMRVETVPVRTRKEAYANVVAQNLRDEIALVEKQVDSIKKKDAVPLRRLLAKMRVQLVEMELEVQRHGKLAIVYVEGPLVLQQVAKLDLVAIAQAEQGGRIKSWTPTEFGIKVEFYDAAASLRDMGRVHGIFEKDNDQSKPVAVLNAQVEVISSGVPIARSEKEAAASV
jgi:phage terminase small subunit